MTKKRIRIEYGKHKIGDLIYDRQIIGFGKVWEAKEVDRENLQAKSWESCRCGKQPIYLIYGLCYDCSNTHHGELKKYQYAYLQDEPVKQPSIFKE